MNPRQTQKCSWQLLFTHATTLPPVPPHLLSLRDIWPLVPCSHLFLCEKTFPYSQVALHHLSSTVLVLLKTNITVQPPRFVALSWRSHLLCPHLWKKTMGLAFSPAPPAPPTSLTLELSSAWQEELSRFARMWVSEGSNFGRGMNKDQTIDDGNNMMHLGPGGHQARWEEW